MSGTLSGYVRVGKNKSSLKDKVSPLVLFDETIYYYNRKDVDFHVHEFMSKVYNLFDEKKVVTFEDIEKIKKEEFE